MEDLELQLQPTPTENFFNFGMEPLALDYLKTSAKWEKFMAIVGITSISIAMVVIIFGGGAFLNFYFDSLTQLQTASEFALLGKGFITGILIFYALLLGIFLIPNIFRLKYANNCLKAINNTDTQKLTIAFKHLRVYSAFWGIVTIIGLACYALFFVMMIVSAAMAASL